MPAKYVIHTVGPIYGQNGGKDAELLAACYLNSLSLAADRSLDSIAFPAISTGVYGYPERLAAKVVSEALKEYAARAALPSDIRLVFYSGHHAQVFLANQTL